MPSTKASANTPAACTIPRSGVPPVRAAATSLAATPGWATSPRTTRTRAPAARI